MSVSSSFRHDINFLRAVAVCGVLLFHFGVPIVTGGFAGVDVFFVISGFLMGGIIWKGLEAQGFSYVNFLIARVKRIIPALILLCVFCLVCGWLLLAPDDFHVQALHVRDSLLFISNETYRDEAGYFDASSHDKWLLHTWSLSVEWQFYLLLPVLMWALKRLIKTARGVFNVLALITFIAFCICVDKTLRAPENAFFLLKYRCWEMLLGALIYLLPIAYPYCQTLRNNLQVRLLLSTCGIAAISFSFVYFDNKSAWPSWHAAIPVVGTALLIFSNHQFSLYHARFISWLGSRSYSLYLWHWPLVVLLAYFSFSKSVSWGAAAIVLALVLAELSFRFVEEPIRKARVNRWLICAVIVSLAGVTALLAQWVMHNKGFSERVSPEIRAVLASKYDRNTVDRSCIGNFTDQLPTCQFGANRQDAVVIGDSHAHSIVTAVLAALPVGSGVEYWGFLACPTIAGVTSDRACANFNEAIVSRVRALPENKPVIIASRFSFYPFGEGLTGYALSQSQPQVHFGTRQRVTTEAYLSEYKQHMTAQLCELASSNQVFVVLPIPELIKLVPQTMARSMMRGLNDRVSITLSDYHARNGYILDVLAGVSAKCGVTLLDPLPHLCENGECFGDNAGKPLYYDDDHLNETGNKVLVPMFEKALRY